MQAAQHETDRAGRYGGALSVVMLDIDHFKHVNDSWGHAIGDEVLRRVVHAINLGLRDIDILGRLGGEEFAVLLPETALDQAVAVAERLRQAIAEIQVPVGDGVTTVTASMGVAERCRDDGNVDHLLGRADRALYTAKQAGRDRVLAA
jgi:diguanylate cyclase (GGDEF)-like protein